MPKPATLVTPPARAALEAAATYRSHLRRILDHECPDPALAATLEREIDRTVDFCRTIAPGTIAPTS